jgi:hypothetical protein
MRTSRWHTILHCEAHTMNEEGNRIKLFPSRQFDRLSSSSRPRPSLVRPTSQLFLRFRPCSIQGFLLIAYCDLPCRHNVQHGVSTASSASFKIGKYAGGLPNVKLLAIAYFGIQFCSKLCLQFEQTKNPLCLLFILS